ncbi:MAG: hypothetical protein AAF213_13455, partial [Pseudomonadota bacterium]
GDGRVDHPPVAELIEQPLADNQLALIDRSPNALDTLSSPILADRYGGPIAVEMSSPDDQTLTPQNATFVARFSLDNQDPLVSQLTASAQQWQQIGTGVISTEPVSIASNIFRRVRGILLRELAF